MFISLRKVNIKYMNNPFITNGYAGPKYFCDREQETKTITDFLTNGNNIALISPRRIGKTDLVQHCFGQKEISEEYYTFLIDIYATKNFQDFVNTFGKAVLDTLKPKGKKVWEQFVSAVKSVRPQISFDINNMPSWSIGLGSISNPELTLDEIFSYLKTADKPCIVAIDEFQQITEYTDEVNMEAVLRTHIQKCNNANFLFCGSRRHLMDNIFLNPSRPFYQSVTVMNLYPIPMDTYVSFAMRLFTKNGGRRISADVIKDVYQRFDGVTANIQRIMNLLYMRTQKGEECKLDDVQPTIDYYIDLCSDTYSSLLYQMPEKQRLVFLALASEDGATKITSSEFIKKHSLSSASSVSSAVTGLLANDFITREEDTYYVYDKFFQIWCRKFLNR